MGQSLLNFVASRSYSDTPHSLGLLWTSDRLDAEISVNTQRSKEIGIHTPGGIRTRNPTKLTAADQSFVSRVYCDWHGVYEGRTESHKQLLFACELGTADEGECGGR